MNKPNAAHSHSGAFLGHEKHCGAHQAAMGMNLEPITLSKRSQAQNTLLYDSTYMKCPYQADPHTQKVHSWVPRAKGRGDGT